MKLILPQTLTSIKFPIQNNTPIFLTLAKRQVLSIFCFILGHLKTSLSCRCEKAAFFESERGLFARKRFLSKGKPAGSGGAALLCCVTSSNLHRFAIYKLRHFCCFSEDVSRRTRRSFQLHTVWPCLRIKAATVFNKTLICPIIMKVK